LRRKRAADEGAKLRAHAAEEIARKAGQCLKPAGG